jgi:hypothetical protein
MTDICGNIKAELETNHEGLTALAQLVAVYTSAGIISAADISKRTGYSERAIRKAKTELGCRNQGATGTPVPEPGCRDGTPVPPAEPECRNPGAASCARIETPSGLLSTSEVKQELSEPSVSDHAEKPTPKARRRFSYTAEFQAFWSAYPVTGNSSKSEAFREWRLLLPAEQMLATDGLRHLAEHCRKNPTYTCLHACRYLSQRRWESYETPAQRLAAKPKPAEPDHLKWERIYAEVEAINAM